MIFYMPTTLPGISVTQASRLLQMQDRMLKTFPEVEWVFGKAGRAETSTDPAPFSMGETTVMLKPESQWRPGMTWEKLVEEMDKKIRLARRGECLDDADQEPHRHAFHRHSYSGRDQDLRSRSDKDRGDRPAN